MDIRSALPDLGALHASALGDPRVCVAVLDGPVDFSHPCLEGADLGRIDTLVTDPAGDGPMSLHGTHVTSVLFGQPGSTVTGAAPGCRGLIAPVFRDDRRRLSQLDLARAIEQAVGAGAHVINVSGGQRSPTGRAEGVLERALRHCEDSNVLVVAAVGNDGCECLHVPAALPSVLAVGAAGTDGEPLDISNWGAAYRSNGVLAPGQDIHGAAPGGGVSSLTGSSFATPIVAGVAAVLLSEQLALGRRLDPVGVGRAIVKTAVPCEPRASEACGHHLAGTLDIEAARASIREGAHMTETASDTVKPPTTVDDVGASGHEASLEPPVGANPAVASEVVAAGSGPTPAPADRPSAGAEPGSEPSARAVVDGVRPSSSGCGCQQGPSSFIFALGDIGFDFGTEARRDTFRQLMPGIEVEGDPPSELPANPYDVVQLVDYLDANPWDSTRLIWTLNLDLTPIYALEADRSYAEDVYRLLREALRRRSLAPNHENYVSKVSIPGTMTSKTVRLFSGQTVPVVVVHPRGMFAWNESGIVNQVVESVRSARADMPEETLRLLVRNFLDKVYYELRNLGQSAPDRALNYAATNAFQFALSQVLRAGETVPGGGNLYALDTITVEPSPYCRMDSECYLVKVIMFDPEEVRRAKVAFQYTVDVSDEMPVSLAPLRWFPMTP